MLSDPQQAAGKAKSQEKLKKTPRPPPAPQPAPGTLLKATYHNDDKETDLPQGSAGARVKRVSTDSSDLNIDALEHASELENSLAQNMKEIEKLKGQICLKDDEEDQDPTSSDYDNGSSLLPAPSVSSTMTCELPGSGLNEGPDCDAATGKSYSHQDNAHGPLPPSPPPPPSRAAAAATTKTKKKKKNKKPRPPPPKAPPFHKPKPPGMRPPPPPPPKPKPPAWLAYYSNEHGCSYYESFETGLVQWEKPPKDEIIEYKDDESRQHDLSFKFEDPSGSAADGDDGQVMEKEREGGGRAVSIAERNLGEQEGHVKSIVSKLEESNAGATPVSPEENTLDEAQVGDALHMDLSATAAGGGEK